MQLFCVVQALEYLLVHCNANPDSTDAVNGATLLHWASERGNLAIVQLLIQNGAEVDKTVWEHCENTNLICPNLFKNSRIGKEVLHCLKHVEMVMFTLPPFLSTSMYPTYITIFGQKNCIYFV